MATTLKDIAKHTGLSIPTISLALNNKDTVNEKTKQIVLKAAKELSYRPNAAARTIKDGKFKAVTYLWPQNLWHIPEGLINGINDKLADRKMNMTVAQIPKMEMLDIECMPKVLREQGTDGILINYSPYIPSQALDIIAESKLPVLWINAQHSTDCIRPNDFGAGVMAAEHLISKGHKKLGFLCHTELDGIHYSVVDRQNGFTETANKHNATVQVYHKPVTWGHLQSPKDDRIELAKEILRQEDRPTAFFCYENHEATPLVAAALSLGLRIPDDLSIVVAHKQVLTESGFGIDSLVINWHDLGKQAVDLLLKKVDEPEKTIESVNVDYTLIECGSCKQLT